MFNFYSKPRIILVGRSQKDARRLIEAFDERFDTRYVEEVSEEFSRFADAMIFDYVNENIINSLRIGTIPYLCLIGSEKSIAKFNLQPGEFMLKGPGYLRYLPEIVYSMLEKQRLQKTLDFEREKYMGLVNSMGCGMLILRKRDGVVIFANRIAQCLLEYKEDEMEQLKLQNLVYDEPTVNLMLEQEASITDREMIMATKSGRKLYIMFNTSEMLYGAERVIQLSFMDVSKQKRDKEELIFQWRLLDKAEEVAIAIDEKDRIVYLNRFAAEVHGYQREEMLGNKLSDYIVQDLQEAKSRHFAIMKSGKWKGMQIHKRKDGTLFTVEAKRSVLRIDENAYELVIGMDITESIELEKNYELHSLLLDATGDIAIAIDGSGRVIYMNEAAQRYFQTPLELVSRKLHHEITSASLRDFLVSARPDADGDAKKITFENGQESKSLVEFTCKVVRNKNDEIATIFIGRETIGAKDKA